MYATYVHVHGSQKRVPEALELELQVGARNQNLALWKSPKDSSLLSCLSGSLKPFVQGPHAFCLPPLSSVPHTCRKA